MDQGFGNWFSGFAAEFGGRLYDERISRGSTWINRNCG
jgi:hypothetical protein